MKSPKSFSFMLTDQYGKRTYATCLIITEEISDSFIKSVYCIVKQFTPVLISDKKLYIEKAICVIGDQPFYQNFKNFLKELYRIQLSNSRCPLEVVIRIILENHLSFC
jgi:hypothetical protein